MIPKIGSALAKFLEPLKPVQKTSASGKASDDASGGHGNLPAESWKTNSEAPQDQPEEKPEDPSSSPDSFQRFKSVPRTAPLSEATADDVPEASLQNPVQLGLTQVIVDIHSSRKDVQNGSGIQSYESGSREQKSGTRLPKGSMLDKKIG